MSRLLNTDTVSSQCASAKEKGWKITSFRRKLWGESFVSCLLSLSLIINYKFVQGHDSPLYISLLVFSCSSCVTAGTEQYDLLSPIVCFNRPTVLLLRWDDKTGVVWLNKKLDKPVGSVFVLKVSFLYKVNAWYTVTSLTESTTVFLLGTYINMITKLTNVSSFRVLLVRLPCWTRPQSQMPCVLYRFLIDSNKLSRELFGRVLDFDSQHRHVCLGCLIRGWRKFRKQWSSLSILSYWLGISLWLIKLAVITYLQVVPVRYRY